LGYNISFLLKYEISSAIPEMSYFCKLVSMGNCDDLSPLNKVTVMDYLPLAIFNLFNFLKGEFFKVVKQCVNSVKYGSY
jgi:hypothetical protein